MADLSWTEPGAYPVSDGVWRIPLPLPMDGLRAVNVYVLETEEGLVLIDGGWAIPEAREQLVDSLRQAGHALSDIRRFLVTHVHRDHYTQAVALRQEVGAHVSLGIGEKPSLDLLNAAESVGDNDVRRLRRAGAHELDLPWTDTRGERPPVEYYDYPDAWLEASSRVDLGGRELDVVPTPGHTQGHVVFADTGGGLLFAGDHVLPQITPSIGFEPAWVQQPLRDFLDSLRRVRELPDLRLLPAHGPVTDSSYARVDELLAFHDERLADTLAAARGGARTGWEVAQELPWTRRRRRAVDLTPFDQVLAAFETLSHLELLVLRGQLARGEEDGVAVFAPV
ncbi:MBL fold metallo-hydrolase [Marmoricola endophyticus]|uniref:MBL fold metallo-hydrolase n=1 Tax=Marmoricola endophyticus TaxID=2040280 RepID=A0A917BLE1_9ACTN|nr:MBL fold metallo-hydrolase [Marmoricola endophyticus]GGF50764.1 MBL fold metallo-hydrolase [Marmoricola endophyticus]